MKTTIPLEMKAIRQHKADGELQVESIPVPRAGPGEVLVQMAASPINPSDLALLKGGYMKRNFPFTPGLEGSGLVVASGGGLLARLRLGKRVACTPTAEGDGTWAEYMLTSAMRTIPLPRGLSLKQGAMTVVNPMTAMAFIHMARKGKHQALVNSAAASSLGKMLIRLSAAYGIPLINIVRNPEQVEELHTLGARHVLNSQEEEFESKLSALSSELGATLFLDAVAGSFSRSLLRAAPRGAILLIYARLSGEEMELDPGELITEDKSVQGFQLGQWLQSKGILFKLFFISRLKRNLTGILSSNIEQTFPLEEAEGAIAHSLRNRSKGKTLLLIHEKKTAAG